MNVYLEKQDIPNKCTKCFFVNSNDECILQDDDANFMADTWDDLLRNCPLKEVEQVKHGRWVKDIYVWNEVPTSYCSCCGQPIADECAPWFKYCPNCGVKIDKE